MSREKGLEIYAWCIMPSHVHLIIGTTGIPMQDILRDFKRFTSSKLKKAIKQNVTESRKEWMMWMMERAGKKNSNNKGWQLWQQHNKPIELTSNKMMDQKLDYIHANPVVSGFVSMPSHWRCSSASVYEGRSGLLEILIIE